VLGTSPEEEEAYQSKWETEVSALGATEQIIEDAKIRMKEDQNALLEDQLNWLKESGFAEVKCWYQNGRFAVFGGLKPERKK